MKKTLIAAGMMAALGVTGTANAVFTPLADGNYTMSITGGCFDFGNCATSGKGVLSDNTTPNQATAAAFGSAAGSGITNDGLVGVIDFTLTGGSMSVTSFSQDGYQGTSGGTFYLRSTNLGTMGGTIDGSGNVTFDPTGRQGLAASFAATLGEQPWNLDNSVNSPGTGLFTPWTSSTSTNRAQGFTPAFTLTGSALEDAGAGTWTGTLVSAGIIGSNWGDFDGTQYSEVFNVTVTGETTVVPVPAAVWLFGSGLMGLVGVARRRKQA